MLRPDYGESVELGRPVPSLAEYYRPGLRLVAEPGTRFLYGDHGIATLGQIVEDVSGKPLDRYFREHIFEPLGMADSDLVRSDRVRAHLATGYKLLSTGPVAVTDREMVTAAAGSIYSTTRDMALYMAALLGGGANEHGSVLKPATLAIMFESHYQPDPRIPGMGLTFFRGDLGGHLAVEHQGILPGFNSQIFLAPDDGVGVLAFTNGAQGALMWMPGEVAGLLNLLLGVPAAAIRTDVPQHLEVWDDICGWYRYPGRLMDVRMKSVLGAGAEVFVRRGQLMLRVLSPVPALLRGFALHPDDDKDPYVFRIDLSQFGIGTVRVVFTRVPGVGTTAVQADFMPVSLQKQPATKNPRLWLTGALGVLAVVTAAGVVRRRRATVCRGGSGLTGIPVAPALERPDWIRSPKPGAR